jgi:hypothetical protein
MPFAEFAVPKHEAGSLESGRWFWDLASWPGVRHADLNAMFGTLSVEGSRRALRRVARFCASRGYARVGGG